MFWAMKGCQTHKRLVHGPLDLVGSVAVDLLEDLVERRVSLQLLVLLLLADVHHQLVPLAGVVGRRGVLICWENDGRLRKRGVELGLKVKTHLGSIWSCRL